MLGVKLNINKIPNLSSELVFNDSFKYENI